jgi:hypothetical protein
MRPIKPTDENNFNFDKAFRDNLRNMEVTPPAGLWDKLDADLDVQIERRKYNHWYYAAIAVLIFFGSFNLITSFDIEEYYASKKAKANRSYEGTYLLAGEHPSQIAGFSYSHYQRINYPIDYTFDDSEPLVTVSNYGRNRYFTPYIGVNASSKMYGDIKRTNKEGKNRLNKAQQHSLVDLELHAPANPLYIAFTAKNELLNSLTIAPSTLKPQLSKGDYENDDIISNAKPISTLGNIKGLYVGAEYAFTGTRMFQKNSVFYPLLANDAKYNMQAGRQYGIKVGYHFNHRMALELGWIVSSTQGQRFSDNLYGKIPVSGSINLNYTQVPLLFKYKFARMSGLTKQPVSLNVIGGIAYSHLKSSEMNLNTDRLENISQMVTRNELGVIVGLEYDVYLYQNLFVTFGTRTAIFADTQLFKGYEKEEARMYNFTLGASAAIHYQLPKRKAKLNPEN